MYLMTDGDKESVARMQKALALVEAAKSMLAETRDTCESLPFKQGMSWAEDRKREAAFLACAANALRLALNSPEAKGLRTWLNDFSPYAQP